MNRITRLVSFFAGMACALGAATAFGQEYPSKPIRIIVASSPGTLTDLVPRAITTELGKALGQAVVIENKTGASGLIAFEYVAKQVPADGYTVLAANVVDLAVLPLVVKDLRFNPLIDLPPVIDIAQGYTVLTSSNRYPWKTFNEWVAYVKANPGKVNYGASIVAIRLPMLQLIQELGLDLFYIPYGAGAAYSQAVLVGDVMGFLSESVVLGNADKAFAIAAPGDQRRPSLPNVPTFAELGYPQVKATLTFSLNVPTATPNAVVEKLNAAAARVLQLPDVRQQLLKIRYEAVGGTPQAAARKLADTARAYAETAKKAGIQPE